MLDRYSGASHISLCMACGNPGVDYIGRAARAVHGNEKHDSHDVKTGGSALDFCGNFQPVWESDSALVRISPG